MQTHPSRCNSAGSHLTIAQACHRQGCRVLARQTTVQCLWHRGECQWTHPNGADGQVELIPTLHGDHAEVAGRVRRQKLAQVLAACAPRGRGTLTFSLAFLNFRSLGHAARIHGRPPATAHACCSTACILGTLSRNCPLSPFSVGHNPPGPACCNPDHQTANPT